MKWIEVKIYTTRNGIEPVSAVLFEAGITGIQVQDDDELKEFLSETSIHWDYVSDELLNKKSRETSLKIYVSDNIYGRDILISIKDAISRLKSIENEIGIKLGTLNIELTDDLDDEEWLNKWKEHYKPFEIGQNVLIKPMWENVQNYDDKVIFNINPGNVFGTGLHPTTQFCIISLEKYVNNESIVLDLGCGSGILSIISLLLGAKSAFAVDIDENAVKIAYENASLNDIGKDKYYVTAGNIVTDPKLNAQILDEQYDIVLANIIADVICEITPTVMKKIKKNGIFIASGIIKDKLNDVYSILENTGFDVVDTIQEGEWVCVVSKK